MARPRGNYDTWAAQTLERIPPFLLVADGADLVLIAPFPRRRHGPTPDEAAIVRGVAGCLPNLATARGSVWIDPQTGAATPASIGEPQLRRRMIDCASFNVRMS